TAGDGPAEARARLLPILRRARETDATIHLDSEHDEVKDLTFELLRTLGEEFPDGPQLGAVVQAYRKDAFDDLRELIAWSARALRRPLVIRLVKGAYWDFETVVARAEAWPGERGAQSPPWSSRRRPRPTTGGAFVTWWSTPVRCGLPAAATTCAASRAPSPPHVPARSRTRRSSTSSSMAWPSRCTPPSA